MTTRTLKLSTRASRFESPQPHHEFCASGGRFAGFKFRPIGKRRRLADGAVSDEISLYNAAAILHESVIAAPSNRRALRSGVRFRSALEAAGMKSVA
jgi:hypothetical protein